MDDENRVRGEVVNLGGLLVTYLFVGLAVGSVASTATAAVGNPLSLTSRETTLVVGALVTAAAEVAGERPGPLESVGFGLVFAGARLPFAVPAALVAKGPFPLVAGDVVALAIAYVLALRWGATGTARRFERGLARLARTPWSGGSGERG